MITLKENGKKKNNMEEYLQITGGEWGCSKMNPSEKQNSNESKYYNEKYFINIKSLKTIAYEINEPSRQYSDHFLFEWDSYSQKYYFNMKNLFSHYISLYNKCHPNETPVRKDLHCAILSKLQFTDAKNIKSITFDAGGCPLYQYLNTQGLSDIEISSAMWLCPNNSYQNFRCYVEFNDNYTENSDMDCTSQSESSPPSLPNHSIPINFAIIDVPQKMFEFLEPRRQMYNIEDCLFVMECGVYSPVGTKKESKSQHFSVPFTLHFSLQKILDETTNIVYLWAKTDQDQTSIREQSPFLIKEIYNNTHFDLFGDVFGPPMYQIKGYFKSHRLDGWLDTDDRILYYKKFSCYYEPDVSVIKYMEEKVNLFTKNYVEALKLALDDYQLFINFPDKEMKKQMEQELYDMYKCSYLEYIKNYNEKNPLLQDLLQELSQELSQDLSQEKPNEYATNLQPLQEEKKIVEVRVKKIAYMTSPTQHQILIFYNDKSVQSEILLCTTIWNMYKDFMDEETKEKMFDFAKPFLK